MPDPALPQPREGTATGTSVGGLFVRCPRGARVAPAGTPGDTFCSICDCERRSGR
jgi:hypothetical protein